MWYYDKEETRLTFLGLLLTEKRSALRKYARSFSGVLDDIPDESSNATTYVPYKSKNKKMIKKSLAFDGEILLPEHENKKYEAEPMPSYLKNKLKGKIQEEVEELKLSRKFGRMNSDSIRNKTDDLDQNKEKFNNSIRERIPIKLKDIDNSSIKEEAVEKELLNSSFDGKEVSKLR